jgi:hypothetical protein
VQIGANSVVIFILPVCAIYPFTRAWNQLRKQLKIESLVYMYIFSHNMTTRYEYPDGSKLVELDSNALCRYEAWTGQRPLNQEHIAAIAESVGDDVSALDRDYKLVKIRNEDAGRMECYILDGQHRAEVLRRHAAAHPLDNFKLTATVYDYTDRTMDEVNDLFLTINSVRPFTDDDAATVDINRISAAVMMHFNEGLAPKDTLIRQAKTRAPYICVSEISDWLRALASRLGELPDESVVLSVLVDVNAEKLRELAVSDDAQDEKFCTVGFALKHKTMTKVRWTAVYLERCGA